MIKKRILNLFSNKLNTNSYEKSLFIRKLYYKTVPYVLFLFLITIFFWSTINDLYQEKKIVSGITENQKKTKNFTFQGIDELNQPFYLHAKKYQKITNNNNKLLFEKPSAEINLKKGKWLTMNAEKGVFDIEKQSLELIENVIFLHSDWEQIDTNNAIIDLKNAKIYGNKKIFGKNETISFSSEGFEVQKTVKNFQLLGKSKINIKNIK